MGLVPRRARKALRARCGGRQRDRTAVTRGSVSMARVEPRPAMDASRTGWAVASVPVRRRETGRALAFADRPHPLWGEPARQSRGRWREAIAVVARVRVKEHRAREVPGTWLGRLLNELNVHRALVLFAAGLL